MNKIKVKDIPTKDILLQQNKWSLNNLKSGGLMSPPEKDYVEDIPFTYEAFPQWPEKVVYRKMEKLADEGYLEYGVSLRTAWLTKKGLGFLNK